MKYKVIHLGTLKVNAFEMIMGVSGEEIRRKYTVDSRDQMRIGMNGLIVETGGRILFFDPGTATFLSKSLAETYDLAMEKSLSALVRDAGYRMEDFTDVVFTHLHFDHGSGAFLRVTGGIEKAFPNANYLVSMKQLEAIKTLPVEESSSFFHKLLRFAGKFTPLEEWAVEGIAFLESNGHTPHMQVPLIDAGDHDILYASDLIPMKLHLEEGVWSYYDVDRELINMERKTMLSLLRPGSEIIFYHEV